MVPTVVKSLKLCCGAVVDMKLIIVCLAKYLNKSIHFLLKHGSFE